MKSRDELAATVARMDARFGIEPPKEDLERHLLAREIRPGVFELDGKRLSAEDLQAAMQEQYDADHEFDDIYPEPIRGESVDKAARALLAKRGIWNPTSDEYLSACQEAGAR